MCPGVKAFWELLFWHLIKLWGKYGSSSSPAIRLPGGVRICLSGTGLRLCPGCTHYSSMEGGWVVGLASP